MAWTSTAQTLIAQPFVVTKVDVVPDSTTATAVAHGGPSTLAPDLVLFALTKANPTASEVSVTATSTTTVTFDVEGSTNPFSAYCFFFPQARQDGQSITSDNDS